MSGGDSEQAYDVQWWRDEHADDRHRIISNVCDNIYNYSVGDREDMHRFARLYSPRAHRALGIRGGAMRTTGLASPKLVFNVIKTCADAYTAKLTKERPKISFVTSGGTWSEQELSRDLDKFIEGQFYESDIYNLSPSIVLDTAVYGLGIMKVFQRGAGSKARIACERVHPLDLLTDDADARYGRPRTVYERHVFDREVLRALFPDKKLDLLETKKFEPEDSTYEVVANDQVLVLEAWHLPSADDAEDGRHVICVENSTLLDEPWTKDYLPFAFLRRADPLEGFWGIGLAEELMGIQLEINILLRKIQQSHLLLAAGHWLVENGSKVNFGQLTNEVGQVIRYTGTPPQIVAQQTVSPEVYAQLDRLYSKAFELTGISQLSAQSQKPPGLNSGKALLVYADVESDRFVVPARLYQHWYLEIAERMIAIAREIATENPGYTVRIATKNEGMQRIKAALLMDLKDEEYVLKLFPTNALADDPSARLEQVQELANAGWLDPADAKRLLDFPDLEAASSYENASYEQTMQIIESLKSGSYIGPQPFLDLKDALRRVQLAYLKYWRLGLSEDRLQLFRQWLDEASAMLAPPPAAPPAPAPGGGLAPPPQMSQAPIAAAPAQALPPQA